MQSPLRDRTVSDPDQQCYLCPGNKRAQGDTNPQYETTFVFVNDYSAVKEEQAEYKPEGDPKGIPSFLLLYPNFTAF
jgi:UDPglucose--hexose-1-phosphate uridylyltransferase